MKIKKGNYFDVFRAILMQWGVVSTIMFVDSIKETGSLDIYSFGFASLGLLFFGIALGNIPITEEE